MQKDIVIEYSRKIKNNKLRQLMEDSGVFNIAQLSKETGVSQQNIYHISNLKCRTSKSPSLIKISNFFNVKPEYLMSDSMIEVGKLFRQETNEIRLEVDSNNIINFDHATELLYLEENAESIEKKQLFNGCLKLLTERQRKVLEMRYVGDTLEEVAKELKVTRERVRQIEAKAIVRVQEKLGLRSVWDREKYRFIQATDSAIIKKRQQILRGAD